MKKIIVNLENDTDTESPMEWAHNWRLYSFSRRHTNHADPEDVGLSLERDEDGTPKIKNIGLRSRMRRGLAFFCSYFEHSGSLWSLTNDPKRPRCQFDSTSYAGLLVYESGPENMGAKTPEERAVDAQKFLDVYNEWANGETYYYSIEDENGDPIDDLSCGGYIGGDDFFRAVKDAIESIKEPVEIEWRGEATWLVQYKWEDTETMKTSPDSVIK